jgi:hypothetical protein
MATEQKEYDMTIDCDRCGENSSKKAKCPFCDFVCCQTCFDTYILTTTGDTKCMNCKEHFDLNTIWKLSTRFNNYLDFRFEQLLQKEKSLFQETLMQIERSSGRAQSEEKQTFIKHCSVPSCKGTVNGKWNCRLCNTPHCDKCGEVVKKQIDEETKEGEHVCDPNLVQTFDELKKNSKSCPKCAVSIFKTEGCDQMFCVVCHTAFSWTTLEIETGRIHNPHYYEILRTKGEIGREEGDIRPCDELVFHLDRRYSVYNHILVNLKPLEKLIFLDAPRFVTELDSRWWNEREYVLNNETFYNLREIFLTNQIDEDTYKEAMKKKFVHNLNMFEISQVCTVLKIAISEELKKLVKNEDGSYIRDFSKEYLFQKYTEYQNNIVKIIENTNRILFNISEKYESFFEVTLDTGRYNMQQFYRFANSDEYYTF